MNVVKHIICELTGYRPGTVDVSQGDRGSRAVSCRLLESGAPWMIPEGATARVAYTLPDGTEGLYDRRPDGSPMWEIAGNIVTVELADQLMAQAGMVQMSILVIGPEGGQLATWPIRVMVIADSPARLPVPEAMPPYGAGFAGKIFFGGEDGTVTPLGIGDGVEIVLQEDGTFALVASGGSGGGAGITEEKDPTVPAWAKQPQKPTYTAQEVGAMSAGTNIPSKTSELTNDAGFVDKTVSDLANYYTRTQTQELIATIPRFRVTVVQQLPAAGEEFVLYLVPFATAEGQYLEYIWVDGRWEIIGSQRVDLSGYATEEWVQVYVEAHSGQNVELDTTLTKSGEAADAKAVGDALDELEEKIPSIEGLAKTEDIPTKPEDIGAQPAGDYLTTAPVTSVNGKEGAVQLGAADVGARSADWMPTANEVGARPDTWTPTANEVGADPTGTAAVAVSAHNTSGDSHNDIRLEIRAIREQLAAFLDVDEETLNELSELIARIVANQTSIAQLTTGKVNVTDIIDNLTTNVANKPLSAAQGVAIKALIDGLSTGKLDASKLQEAINTALAQAKASGEFDGKDGTSVTVTSVSESTEDGGDNVVTFSDGKTLTIKNGKAGTGEGSYIIPDFWQSSLDATISAIKTLQAGKNCVTFPFFSDNHQRNGYAGMLIAKVMKECHIPYCFYGGDSISNGIIANEAEMIAQDKAFDESMSYIPNGRFCRAVGNHDGYWYDGTNKHYYDRDQVYELFLREESVAQNKHFGGNGTYYYVDDLASKVRFVVLNTNVHRDASGNIVGKNVEAEQLEWIRNKALNFDEDGWDVVVISHQPLSNHYHANISNAEEVRAALTERGVDIIGCFSGHIHRDRIYSGVAVNTTDDSEGADMGFKQITITSDNTTISYDDATKHTVAEDALSHAIDFVTINRGTKKVNLTRLGIGNNRAYSYDNVILHSITNTLTNVSNSNGSVSIEAGQAYVATLTANSGYALSTVKVTMGGTDVTASVYSNGAINIASVTGDIVITATATKTVVDPSYTNLADLTDTSDNNWKTGYRLNSSGVSTESTASPAPMVTNYVACSNGDVIRVKELKLGDFNCSIYKGNKVNVSSSKPTFPGTATASWTAEMEGADVYKFTVANAEATYMRFSGVPVGAASDIVITKNEAIV